MATKIAGVGSSACHAITATATMNSASTTKRIVRTYRRGRRAGRPCNGLRRRRPRGAGRARLGGRLGLLRPRGLRWKPDLALGQLFHLPGKLVDAPAELRRHGGVLGPLRRRRRLLLGLLLGLALELGKPHAQIGQLVRQTKALGLHGERPELRDLLRLALEAVEHLAKEGGQHVFGASGLGQLHAGPGAGQERGGGAVGRGAPLGVLEQPVAHELRAGDAPAAVPDDRAQRPTLDPPGDRLPAEPSQIGRFGDGVRPQNRPWSRAFPFPAQDCAGPRPGAARRTCPGGATAGSPGGADGGDPGTPQRGTAPNRAISSPLVIQGLSRSKLGPATLGWGQSRGVAQPG